VPISGILTCPPCVWPHSHRSILALLQVSTVSGLCASTIIVSFSGLTIFIACLGLFALASHNSVQRTKEIGIRKALGASARNIYLLLSKEFLSLVLLASAVAIPFTYYQMNNWLKSFAYRIDIPWWVFIAAWAIVTAVVLLTISYQSIRAALANPVDALKYE